MPYRLELLPTAEGAKYYKDMPQTRDTGNAGVDLYVCAPYSASYVTTAQLLDLGCSARLVRLGSDGGEEDCHYWLCPRSSIYKSGVMMTNSQGVIDKTYRGTLKAPVTLVSREALGDQTFEGIRLFQIVAPDMGDIVEVRIVESLSETARGSGGFGSTGTSGDAGERPEQPAGERPEQPAGERPEQQSLADLLVSGVNVTTL